MRPPPPRPPRRGARVPIAERGPGASYRPDDRPPSIVGAHQAGIATPLLDHLSLAAFDLQGTALQDLLGAWSALAERMMAAEPGALTVTLGLGPGVFGDRLGLRAARPAALRELPPFPGDELQQALCGGDLCVQACGREAAAAREAVGRLAQAARGAASVRWRQTGSLRRAPGDRPGGNPRDVLGFRSGTSNLRRGRDLDRHVWAARGERSWMAGGTFLVVRRISVDVEGWSALDVAAQERIIGRRRESGAALGGRGEYDPLALDAHDAAGAPVIAPDAHVRLAAPESNGGVALLRRSYSYDDGIDAASGRPDAGLVFMAYQRDPRRQFVALQRRLAEGDALSAFTRHVGSAVFAVPPGARPGGFIGETLPGMARG
jgi:deferrochelatase/peroxidase EfeB